MKLLLRAVSVLAIVTATAYTQTALPLTVEKALALALENSKSLHASLMRMNYADAKSAETNTARLPAVKFAGAYTRLSDVPPFTVALPPALGGNTFTLSPTIQNNYVLKASVEQPLFTGFRLSAASNAAEYAARAAGEDYANDKSALIYNVRSAYWTLYKALEFKTVVDENVEQVKAHLKDVEIMMEQGLATTNDLLKVRVQLSDAQLRQIETNNNVRLAMISLNNVLGIPLETPLVLESSVTSVEAAGTTDVNALVQRAFENRPDLRAMELRVRAADEGITAAKGNWWPQIFLSANYYYSRPNQRVQPVTDSFKDTWDVSVGVSLDVWNWGKTLHQTDQASAQYEEAKDLFRQMKDAIVLDITQSYLSMTQARERTEVARIGVQQAQESFRVTSTRFKEGLAQNSDLLDAEVALLQAKTNYTQALVDYELARARLQRATGE